MMFSKTELRVLEQVALGKKQVLDIALALEKDKSQIYRLIKSLEKKNFLTLKKRILLPSDAIHVQLLLQQLSFQPSFIEDISGCGLELYNYILDTPRSAKEIVNNIGIGMSTFFLKLKTGRSRSMILTRDNNYVFNKKLYPRLYEFFTEFNKYEESFDKRIPSGSIIYYKTDKEIVFSTKANCDATLTGFSAYSEQGIKIYPVDKTYYFPKKKLSRKEILIHSLYRCEKDKSIQNRILLTLFYVKYKNEFSEIHHNILDNINKVLKGNKIEGYPVLSEMKDRAEIYDIQL